MPMPTRRPLLPAVLLAFTLWVTACSDSPTAPAAARQPATSDVAPAAEQGVEALSQLAAGKCADVAGRRHDARTPLILWTCHGAENQRFTLPAAGATGPIHVYDTNTCVDASGGLGRNGDRIIIYPCNGGANQQWTVTPQGELRGVGGKCIDVSELNSTDGTRLILYTCNGGANQRWAFGTAPVLARDLVVTRGDRAGVAAAPALVATFNVSTATSAVAVVTAADGSVRTTLPVVVESGHARVVLLGLRPDSRYRVAGVALQGGTAVSTSAADTGTTASLPAALAGVRINLTQGAPSGGYVLAPVSTSTGTQYAAAFDRTGSLVWYRAFGGAGVVDVQQHRNGHYTTCIGDARGEGIFYEFDAEGTVLHEWRAPSGYLTDGHEIVLLADAAGQTTGALLFGRYQVTMDLTGHGGSANGTIEANAVIRVAPNGQGAVLFRGPDRFTAADWISPSTSVQQLWDFDHPNAIAPTPDGGFVVSWRNLKAITKHGPTGAFEWQLGGRQATLSYAGDPLGDFDGQHFVRVLPNGHYTFFDNGQLHAPPESRGVEVDVQAAAGTATVVRIDRKRDETVHSPYQSSYQRLGNGNGFMAYNAPGRVIEFTPAGDVAWQGTVVRASGAPLGFYRALRIVALEQYATP